MCCNVPLNGMHISGPPAVLLDACSPALSGTGQHHRQLQFGLLITGGPAFDLAGIGGGFPSPACITTGAMTLGLDGMGGACGRPGAGPVGGAM